METNPDTPEFDVNERMRALSQSDRPTFDAICQSLGMDADATVKSLFVEEQSTTEGLRD